VYNKEIIKTGLTSHGYLYFIDNQHPLAVGNSGIVYLHRHLASLKEGRWLTSEEHVHHIDGCKTNNEYSNLEVLSAEAHSAIHHPKPAQVQCLWCHTMFDPDKPTSRYCSTRCYDLSKVKDSSISKEELDALIPKYSWVELGKMFGYSDNGIKKRAKALGCIIPVRKKKTSGG
jgi:hypothetical protein